MPENSVFNRKISKLEIETVTEASMFLARFLLNYGIKTNIPKNMHDLSRANFYSVVATNLRTIPKSMVDSRLVLDQLQLTHLKIQQAVAKAKPDGIIIDIEDWRTYSSARAESFSLLSCTTSTSRLVYSTTEARTQREDSRIRLSERSETLFATSMSSSHCTTTTSA